MHYWGSPLPSVQLACVRHIYLTSINYGKARTYESKPVPGSEEHVHPNAWAKRLFQLQEKRKSHQPGDQTEIEPPQIHMICRVKPLKGTPHYQRALLEMYGLGKDVKNHTWVLVKNTPSVNDNLYVIKHLIRIQPVLFPQGMPTSADDLTLCRLFPDGRFLRYPSNTVEGKLIDGNGSFTECLAARDKEKPFDHSTGDQGYLKRAYLRQWHNRRWANFELFNEFFASHYKYKLNQDGLEYRYSRLWRLDDAMFHSIRNQRNPDGTMKSPNSNRFDANWCTFPWSKF